MNLWLAKIAALVLLMSLVVSSSAALALTIKLNTYYDNPTSISESAKQDLKTGAFIQPDVLQALAKLQSAIGSPLVWPIDLKLHIGNVWTPRIALRPPTEQLLSWAY